MERSIGTASGTLAVASTDTPVAMPDSKLQGDDVPGPGGLSDDVIVGPDTRRGERLPPNQVRTRKWPVLDSRGAPELTKDSFHFEVTGGVGTELRLEWREFQDLPRSKVFADMHCVTRWSRLGNLWEGVSLNEIIGRAKPLPGADFVVVYGFDSDFTTNLPLSALLSEDALLADTHDGEPIPSAHGGPVRLVVPRLYAWKSVKWVRALELVDKDRPGYWEELGYHMVGDPWSEERFR